jgi:hypothetical protein
MGLGRTAGHKCHAAHSTLPKASGRPEVEVAWAPKLLDHLRSSCLVDAAADARTLRHHDQRLRAPACHGARGLDSRNA